jgi:hypothetical protein
MLAASRRALLDRVSDTGVVLDIGGWADPLPRADWVMDLMPYETRGLYQREGWSPRASQPERFSADTWIQRDICDREPYPFGDGAIDFVVCAHTLEDVRDPVWVCSEMVRIARAGYIEVPSRLEEQSYGFQGPFVGWPHHRWLVDVGESRVDFVVKQGGLESRPDAHFPAGFWDRLAEEERIQVLWWEGSFAFGERIFMTPEEYDDYLEGFVRREMAERGVERPRRRLARWRAS